MKKSKTAKAEAIFWRQRQYVGNYLLNLETQGETFHVINISWISTNVHHKFRSSNICSSFSAASILFSICPIRISNYPSHSLSMYDIFGGENSKLSTLKIFMLAQAGFCTKNIMILILKTLI